MYVTESKAQFIAIQTNLENAGHVLVSHNVNAAGEIELVYSNGVEVVYAEKLA